MREVTGTPDPHIVKAIEELLERARAGEVKSFVGITLDRECRSLTMIHTTSSQVGSMHFACSGMLADLLKFGERVYGVTREGSHE